MLKRSVPPSPSKVRPTSRFGHHIRVLGIANRKCMNLGHFILMNWCPGLLGIRVTILLGELPKMVSPSLTCSGLFEIRVNHSPRWAGSSLTCSGYLKSELIILLGDSAKHGQFEPHLPGLFEIRVIWNHSPRWAAKKSKFEPHLPGSFWIWVNHSLRFTDLHALI